MATKKVNLKITANILNISEILKKLDVDGTDVNVTINGAVELSKANLKYITSEPNIIDWDLMLDSEDTPNKEPSDDLIWSVKKTIYDKDRTTVLFNLYMFLKACVSAMPDTEFSIETIKNDLMSRYSQFKDNFKSNIEDIAMLKIIRIYYSNACLETVYSDITKKLLKIWKTKKETDNIRDFIDKLFGSKSLF